MESHNNTLHSGHTSRPQAPSQHHCPPPPSHQGGGNCASMSRPMSPPTGPNSNNKTKEGSQSPPPVRSNPAVKRKQWISNHLQQSQTPVASVQTHPCHGPQCPPPSNVHHKAGPSPQNGTYDPAQPPAKRVRIQESDGGAALLVDPHKKMKVRTSLGPDDHGAGEECRDSACSPTESQRGDGDDAEDGAPPPVTAPLPGAAVEAPYHHTSPEVEYNADKYSHQRKPPPTQIPPPQMMSHPPHPDTGNGYRWNSKDQAPHQHAPVQTPATSHQGGEGGAASGNPAHYARHAPPPPDYYYQQQHPPQAHHGHYGGHSQPPPPQRRNSYPQAPHHYLHHGAKTEDKAVNRTCSTSSDSTATSTPPQSGIDSPHHHDVLCGRGSNINTHPGNVTFRRLVNGHKVAYVNGSRRDKGSIARHIVAMVRQQDPPGRFLARDVSSNSSSGSQAGTNAGLWFEIDDKEALAKCSQALRENASAVRNSLAAAAAERRGRMEEQAIAVVEEKQQGVGSVGLKGAPVSVPEIQASTSSGSNGSECSTSTAEMTARFRLQQQAQQHQGGSALNRSHSTGNIVPTCSSLSFGLSVDNKRHSMDGTGPPLMPSPQRKFSDDESEMMEDKQSRHNWPGPPPPTSRDHWGPRPSIPVPPYGHPHYPPQEEHHGGGRGQGQSQGQHTHQPPPHHHHRPDHRHHLPVHSSQQPSPHRRRARSTCPPSVSLDGPAPELGSASAVPSHNGAPLSSDASQISQDIARTDDFLSESAKDYRGHLESSNQHLRGMCSLLQSRVSDLEEEVRRLAAVQNATSMGQSQGQGQGQGKGGKDCAAWSKDAQQSPSPSRREQRREDDGKGITLLATPNLQRHTPQQQQQQQQQQQSQQTEEKCRLDVAASLLAAAQSLRGVASPSNVNSGDRTSLSHEKSQI